MQDNLCFNFFLQSLDVTFWRISLGLDIFPTSLFFLTKMVQVSRCLGFGDLGIWGFGDLGIWGFGVKIIGFPTSWQDAFSPAGKVYEISLIHKESLAKVIFSIGLVIHCLN
ncbi:hypothetical protein RhiirA4_509922 [Rhizophagus irregularis]|uniref:Uncharacterized protein n=1 Tax=Rhizophagus irregularis TaxID=588596 RepID=A0A2I1GA07_9GLOM|nr:hypothetical protein RhiirA4_509922 [Rhizophagus irregularis]